MNTAREINFLTVSDVAERRMSLWNILAKLPVLNRLVHPEATRESLIPVQGGFSFEYVPNITYQSGVVGGLVGTLLFGLVGGVLASGQPLPRYQSPSSMSEALHSITRSDISPSKAAAAMDASSERVTHVSSQVASSNTAASKSSKSVITEVEENEESEEKQKMTKTVLGFLPHWSLDDLETIDFDSLTSVAYFDLNLTADGRVDSSAPGYQKLQSGQANPLFQKARKTNTDILLTFTAFDNQVIESLITSAEYRDRATDQIVAMTKKYDTAGANIDVEYQGNASGELRRSYTDFIRLAVEKMHREAPGSQVTVSMYAGSAKYTMLYDIKPLSEASDGVFLMAYDFATTGSSHAMSHSPLSGSSKSYWYDISQALVDFEQAGAAMNKVILGVPFYGYDWPTAGKSPKSVVVDGRAGAVTYARIQRILDQQGGERHWDIEAQSPYVTYQEDGQNRMVYFDDAESMALKYDAVNDRDLMGIGIWALGQDGGAPELWQLLKDKFGARDE